MIAIRPGTRADDDALWRILEPTFRAGETYPQPRDISRDAALAYWWKPEHSIFVAEEEGALVGTYYLKANHGAAAGHVANCGYMALPDAAGRGVGRALCRHSLEQARRQGFRAVQFNLVISTNARAVHLWQSCGFEIVGRLPGAFNHPTRGFVDALVMFQAL